MTKQTLTRDEILHTVDMAIENLNRFPDDRAYYRDYGEHYAHKIITVRYLYNMITDTEMKEITEKINKAIFTE